MLEIDGSMGEGGGQIVRTCLALSLLTGKSFHLRNVRAGRSKPGLQPQHLMSARAAATIGAAQLHCAFKGSTDLIFEPGAIQPGQYRFDVGTAGSTSLVLHTLYLPLSLGATKPSALTLIGGTHVSNSPCFHFLDVTWRGYLQRMGIEVELSMRRPGFYPRGGGEVSVTIHPIAKPRGLNLKERSFERATIVSAIAGLPDHVAERQARRSKQGLKKLGIKAHVEEERWPGGPGSVLMITLHSDYVPTHFLGLGARGKPAEKVADEAVRQVKEHLAAKNGAVDLHSADQLVLPLALAEGASSYAVAAVTQHLLTNVAVIQRFVDREITCEGEVGRPGSVHVS